MVAVRTTRSFNVFHFLLAGDCFFVNGVAYVIVKGKAKQMTSEFHFNRLKLLHSIRNDAEQIVTCQTYQWKKLRVL